MNYIIVIKQYQLHWVSDNDFNTVTLELQSLKIKHLQQTLAINLTFLKKRHLVWGSVSQGSFCILAARAGIYIKRYKAGPHGSNDVNGSFHSQNMEPKGVQ